MNMGPENDLFEHFKPKGETAKEGEAKMKQEQETQKGVDRMSEMHGRQEQLRGVERADQKQERQQTQDWFSEAGVEAGWPPEPRQGGGVERGGEKALSQEEVIQRVRELSQQRNETRDPKAIETINNQIRTLLDPRARSNPTAQATEQQPRGVETSPATQRRGFFDRVSQMASQTVGTAQQVVEAPAQQMTQPTQNQEIGFSNSLQQYRNGIERDLSPQRLVVLNSAFGEIGKGNVKEYMDSIKYNWAQSNPDWCGGFTGSQMAKGGVDVCKALDQKDGSGTERAKNWLNMGDLVSKEQAKSGDVVVFDRNGGGHVGIYVKYQGQDYVLEGNMDASGTVQMHSLQSVLTQGGLKNPRFVRVLS